MEVLQFILELSSFVGFVLWSVNDMQGMQESISANNGGLGCIIFDMLKKGYMFQLFYVFNVVYLNSIWPFCNWRMLFTFFFSVQRWRLSYCNIFVVNFDIIFLNKRMNKKIWWWILNSQAIEVLFLAKKIKKMLVWNLLVVG